MVGSRKSLAKKAENMAYERKEVPPHDDLYQLYVIEFKSTREIGLIYNASPTIVCKWLRLRGIPPRKGGQMLKTRTINGVTHKICNGPLCNGAFVPQSGFYKRKDTRMRPICIRCEKKRRGFEEYLKVGPYRIWLESIIRRLGVFETARRIGCSHNEIRRIRTGRHFGRVKPVQYIQRRTARKIVALMYELRITGEVRHRDSISYGHKARGLPEKVVTSKKHLLVPTSDDETEARRRYRQTHIEHEREYERQYQEVRRQRRQQ